MYQREAMWLSFSGADWRPNAVKVGLGAVDAIAGGTWDRTLRAKPQQDYVVIPDQRWLDGINAGAGFIRQFVAAPLGHGATVESQVAGREDGGLRLAVYEPKPGLFPDREPERRASLDGMVMCCAAPAMELGLGAGGRMTQKIYGDEYGIDTWDQARVIEVRVRIVNSEHWARITGEAPPPSPANAEAYMRAGLPWFALYDERRTDIAPSQVLAAVKSVGESQQAQGATNPGAVPAVPTLMLTSK